MPQRIVVFGTLSLHIQTCDGSGWIVLEREALVPDQEPDSVEFLLQEWEVFCELHAIDEGYTIRAQERTIGHRHPIRELPYMDGYELTLSQDRPIPYTEEEEAVEGWEPTMRTHRIHLYNPELVEVVRAWRGWTRGRELSSRVALCQELRSLSFQLQQRLGR